MQSYLFIGGGKDGLNILALDDRESMRLPVGVTDSEVYIRDSLSVGGVSISIFRHESLTSEQVLNRLVEHYRSWCVNRSSGRR